MVYQEIKRNGEQKLGKAPHYVSIGGERMPVYPLVIRKEREFRHVLAERISGVFDLQTGDISDLSTDTVMGIIDRVLGNDLLDVVGLLIPELKSRDQEWIEDNVATAELQHALWAGIKVNYPFVTAMSIPQLLEFAQQGHQHRQNRNASQPGGDT